jgi:hypothetical protein
MTYILDYTVISDGEMTSGSLALRNDPVPVIGDTLRVFMGGRDTILDINGVDFGATTYGIQHINLNCSARNSTL